MIRIYKDIDKKSLLENVKGLVLFEGAFAPEHLKMINELKIAIESERYTQAAKIAKEISKLKVPQKTLALVSSLKSRIEKYASSVRSAQNSLAVESFKKEFKEAIEEIHKAEKEYLSKRDQLSNELKEMSKAGNSVDAYHSKDTSDRLLWAANYLDKIKKDSYLGNKYTWRMKAVDQINKVAKNLQNMKEIDPNGFRRFIEKVNKSGSLKGVSALLRQPSFGIDMNVEAFYGDSSVTGRTFYDFIGSSNKAFFPKLKNMIDEIEKLDDRRDRRLFLEIEFSI